MGVSIKDVIGILSEQIMESMRKIAELERRVRELEYPTTEDTNS